MRLLSLNWQALSQLFRRIPPPLTNDLYKGQMGRIAIVGGSAEYCGAPYYAAQSCLHIGADLAYVYCAVEAAIPIKSYSPELMVIPFYSATAVSDIPSVLMEGLERKHVIVIGPGLGRHARAMQKVSDLIDTCVQQQIP